MQSMRNEDARLKPSARTIWEIQAKACHLSVETASIIYTDLLRCRERSAALGEARRAAVNGPESLRAYQQEVRKRFYECIGGVPDPLGAPAQQTGRQACDGYTLEKVLLQPREGAWASANVYVPAGADAPMPAVLMTVGHDDRGKADPEYQYVAQLLARAGILTLVLDPLGQGERFEHYEAEMDFQPIQGCSGEHDLLDWKAKLTGTSLARWFIQDGLAALDYLAGRGDVDPARIGVTGHSGGGTQCSMLMMAAGDRLACAAPCAYTTDAQAMMEYAVDPDNEMLWPGCLAAGLDYVDLAAGVAPRPVLLLTDQHDFFPREGTLRTLEAARKLWQAAGSDASVEIATAPSQHAYPRTLAHAAAQFFMNCLGARERDLNALLADFTFAPKAPEALRCTPEGHILRFAPDMRTIHDEIVAEMHRCREMRRGIAPDVLKTSLAELIRLPQGPLAAAPRVNDEGVCGHVMYRCVIWRPEAGQWSSGVFLRDMRQADKPLPTVIALWPEGVKRLAEHSGWIHRCLRNGYQVLVMDVAASGALMPARLGTTDMYISWSTMYILNSYLIQQNDSFFAMRTRQIIRALQMLSDWPEADGAQLSLYAEGDFSRYADIAAFLTGTPVCSDEDFQPFEEIVAERYHDQTHTHAWVLPGALTLFDAPEIKSLLRQTGLVHADPACSADR